MRFKPRYSLATLLALITATALLLWGIPEWREYQRRMEFEREVCKLQPGLEPRLFTVLPRHAFDGPMTTCNFSDAEHNYVASIPVFYKRYWYCIYVHQRDLSNKEALIEQQKAIAAGRTVELTRGWPPTLWTQIQVYRLAPIPRGYRAQTKAGKQQVGMPGQMTDRTPQDQYVTDFNEMIAGREPRDLGIQYKLIHADPPLAAD